jgi:hypothetical protein
MPLSTTPSQLLPAASLGALHASADKSSPIISWCHLTVCVETTFLKSDIGSSNDIVWKEMQEAEEMEKIGQFEGAV